MLRSGTQALFSKLFTKSKQMQNPVSSVPLYIEQDIPRIRFRILFYGTLIRNRNIEVFSLFLMKDLREPLFPFDTN